MYIWQLCKEQQLQACRPTLGVILLSPAEYSTLHMNHCAIHKSCPFLHRFVGCNKLKLVHLRLKMRRRKMSRTLLLLMLARLVSTIPHLPLSQLHLCAGVDCHWSFLPDCAVSITVCPAAAKLNAAVLVPATIKDYSLGDMPSGCSHVLKRSASHSALKMQNKC